MLIDYGLPHPGFYHPWNERHADVPLPSSRPRRPIHFLGLQDITVHIGFHGDHRSRIRCRPRSARLYESVDFFLNNGIADLLARTPYEDKRYLPLAQAVKRLAGKMGESFKVMMLGKGIDDDLSVFVGDGATLFNGDYDIPAAHKKKAKAPFSCSPSKRTR